MSSLSVESLKPLLKALAPPGYRYLYKFYESTSNQKIVLLSPRPRRGEGWVRGVKIKISIPYSFIFKRKN